MQTQLCGKNGDLLKKKKKLRDRNLANVKLKTLPELNAKVILKVS